MDGDGLEASGVLHDTKEVAAMEEELRRLSLKLADYDEQGVQDDKALSPRKLNWREESSSGAPPSLHSHGERKPTHGGDSKEEAKHENITRQRGEFKTAFGEQHKENRCLKEEKPLKTLLRNQRSDSESTVTDEDDATPDIKRTFNGTVEVNSSFDSSLLAKPKLFPSRSPSSSSETRSSPKLSKFGSPRLSMGTRGEVGWAVGDKVAIYVKHVSAWCPGRVINILENRENSREEKKLLVLFQYTKNNKRQRARVAIPLRPNMQAFLRKMRCKAASVNNCSRLRSPAEKPTSPPSGGEARVERLGLGGGDPAMLITTEAAKSQPKAAATPQRLLREPKGRGEEESRKKQKQKQKKKSRAATSSGTSPKLRPRRVVRRRKRKFKVLVVGNSKCGKTSIINRYVRGSFTDDYRYTIGCDYSQKEVRCDNTGEKIRLQLWDIAGQDRFINMTRAFFQGAVGAIVVCDVSRKASIDAACRWKAELDNCLNPDKLGFRVPSILIANKVDKLLDVHESFAIGAYVQRTALKMNFEGWFIGSAKLDEKINEAVEFLLTTITREQDAFAAQKRESLLRSPSRAARKDSSTIQLSNECLDAASSAMLDKDKNNCSLL
mmetsp:Transcript_1850/g.3562  ORF Transcript_1850/g.3562 Transcript_1850/m.3562 type:complete len:608 (+) Transcript_1850:78-1901(+)